MNATLFPCYFLGDSHLQFMRISTRVQNIFNTCIFLKSRYAYATYMVKAIIESLGGIEKVKSLMKSRGDDELLNIVYDIGCSYESHHNRRKVCADPLHKNVD